MLDFFKENFSLLIPLFVFIVGWLLPTPKFFSLGQKAGEKMPKQLRKLLAERLDAFEKGLLGTDFRGDKTLIGNSQLQEKVKGLKIELGLEGSKSKARE